MLKTVILIPARFASTRYPGKPLVNLKGKGGTPKPLIQRSYEAACRVPGIAAVHVVTDDDRIAAAVRGFGGAPLMTSEHCRNGTERCAEALDQLDSDVDVVVNFQGDALLTPPGFVTALVDEALTLFEEHRITTLFVIEDGRPVGVVHIHDTPASR